MRSTGFTAPARQGARSDPIAPLQYVFPASKRSVDPRSGIERRHHIDETVLQRAVRHAIRGAGIGKPGSCIAARDAAGDKTFSDVAARQVEMAERAADLAGGVEARDRLAFKPCKLCLFCVADFRFSSAFIGGSVLF